MKINENIKYLRKTVLKITQEEFADKIYLKRNSFAQIESGRNNATDRTIQNICHAFNVNEEWLKTGTGEIFAEQSTDNIALIAKEFNLNTRAKEILSNFLKLDSEKRDKFLDVLTEITEGSTVSLPMYFSVLDNMTNSDRKENIIEMDLYTSPASAGFGNPLTTDNALKETKKYPLNNITKQANFVVKISGNSMEPTIYDKEEIFIKSQPNIENGEVGLFLYNGDALCKRLIKENNKVILRSDNSNYNDIIITEDDTVVTFGKVLLKK